MNIIQCTCALIMAFSLAFAGQAESKQHSSKKTRDRILKEISQNNSYHAKSSASLSQKQKSKVIFH